MLSMLLEARDEDENKLTDQEVRDQVVSLVLAGHETTANSLAWTFERLLRFPAAYDRLRELVRSGGEEGESYVEVGSRFDGSWVPGFEVAEIRGAEADRRFRLRRSSDGLVLPTNFGSEEVRAPANKR